MADDKAGMRQLDSYPSPSMQQSMQPAQQYPYNSNGQHASEEYRASSQQQHTPISHGPLLPPIQHFEGQNMQSHPHYAPMPMNGAQMSQHPPPYPPNQFQYQNGGMQPAMPSSVGPNGQNGMMRYPIPPQGPMPMTPGRGKAKEVKRRTKTGCLTCRKRRIKCDEAHPHCRNCQKSKRECLGYDPIFKPQSGPAAIQPAPANSTTPTSKSTSTPSTTTSTSALQPSAYQQPQSFPGTGGTFVPASNPTQGLDGSLEYGTSLDPALAGSDASLTMAANSYSTTLQPTRQVKSIAMEQLFSLNDVPPQFEAREAPPPNSMPSQKEIDDFYRLHYAPGLDKVFETTWYKSRGMAVLKQDSSLMDFVWQCMERMRARTDDVASIQACQSLEARLVWQLASMPRFAHPPSSANGASNDQLTMDLLLRIDIVEHLLTGQYLPRARVPSPPGPEPHYADQPGKHAHLNFWHQLGRFTSTLDEGSDPNGVREINDALGILRGLLGMLENRDVLYSLAIARHIGGRLLEFNPPQHVVPQTGDPDDEVKKLQIAQQFVELEDQKGTTQVIQRICGMAIRSWILQKQ